MRTARTNAWAAAVGVAASILLWFLIDVGISESATFSGNSPMLNSRFFPRFAVCLLGLSSLACLVGSLLALSAARKQPAPLPDAGVLAPPAADGDGGARKEDGMAGEVRALGLLVLFVLFGLLFHPLGYLPASLLVSSLTLILLRCRNWKYYPLAWAFAGLLYWIFTRLLYVPLP